jgi:hypothetical protein
MFEFDGVGLGRLLVLCLGLWGVIGRDQDGHVI